MNFELRPESRHDCAVNTPTPLRFPEPPGADFVAAFREHFRQTASPETFPGLSPGPFPSTGAVVVLLRPVSVNEKARGGSRVPCPICSPNTGKWLSGGTLIWCEETGAVYLIGPDCYDTLDGGERVAVAINAYNVAEDERRRSQLLADIAGLATDLIGWADAAKPSASAATRSQNDLAKTLPIVRRAIHDALKAGNEVRATWYEGGAYRQEVIGRLEGAAFLTGRWDLPGKLKAATDILHALKMDAGADPLAWAEALSPTVRKDRLDQARGAVAGLVGVRDKLDAASAFLAPANVRVLAEWSGKGPPTEFRASYTASRVTLRRDDSVWEGQVGLRGPAPLPQEADELYGR